MREARMRHEKPGYAELSSEIFLGENANYRLATIEKPVKMSNRDYAETASTYKTLLRSPKFICR